jgi:RNA polymerase sigma factor (sigma-70 family)
MTPPAKSARLARRLLAGPALRFQPDGRLVSLVRDGYESAFEEIFRRYGPALRNYAASIVTAQRADDVTQDAFTKAYLALRGTEKEIQLRPWLYRIVRNTALTSIRDEPKGRLELDDAYSAGVGPEELAEQREEIKRLMAGLQELPEPQRAAIVMRELEGLSHEQIAASLGLSGGAVRQSIYRARRALREGVGLILPLPLLRMLLDEGFAQGASATAAGSGAGIAIKTGVAALLAAGTVTTGTVINNDLKAPADADASPAKTKSEVGSSRELADASSEAGPGRIRHDRADDSGPGGGGHDKSRNGESGQSPNSGPGSQNSGSGSSGRSGTDDSHSGSSGSGSSGSGSSGSGSSGSGSSSPSVSSGSGSSDSGSSGSGSSGSGSDDLTSGRSGSGSSGPGSDDGSSTPTTTALEQPVTP